MPTKQDLIPLIHSGALVETFDMHTEGKHWVFDISAMRQMIQREPKRWELCSTDITESILRIIRDQREVCPERLRALTEVDLADPCILLACDDGTHLMIDGHHRVVARHLKGLRDYEFYNVPFADAPQLDPRLYELGRIEWGELDPGADGRSMVPHTRKP